LLREYRTRLIAEATGLNDDAEMLADTISASDEIINLPHNMGLQTPNQPKIYHILPFTNADWEKLSIFLNFLIPKLPAPKEEDLSRGILEVIDMDSYRAEKKAAMKIALADEDASIGPVPMSGGGHKPELELDRLSNILKSFNDQFGTLFTDADRVIRRIREDIAPKVAADQAYQNAKKNTPNAAGIELDAALNRVVTPLYKDDTEFFKQFVQNESFKRFVKDMVYTLTSEEVNPSNAAET
jgi:type I restriction enzyme, R subunit